MTTQPVSRYKKFEEYKMLYINIITRKNACNKVSAVPV